MKYLAPLVATLLPMLAMAATDAEILREGCNSLKTASKKTACLAAAERAAPSGLASPKEDAIIAVAKQRVTALLNDPESVRFRSAIYSPETKAVCGVLAAKNAMGGYGTPMRFIVTVERARIDQGNEAGFDYRWSESCE